LFGTYAISLAINLFKIKWLSIRKLAKNFALNPSENLMIVAYMVIRAALDEIDE